MNSKIKLGLVAMVLLSATVTSCKYDDDALWESVDDLTGRVQELETKIQQTNSNLSALHTIVTSLQNQVTITSVEQTSTGYTIKFSDGKTAVIANGLNGNDAPEISVIKGDDGLYYWTLDGEILMVDGKPVCANGIKGDAGESAIAPQIRINSTTKMWEISVDGGTTWTSTGIVADGTNGTNGADGDTLFSEIVTANPDYVTFKLANGTQLDVPKYKANAPKFVVEGAEGTQVIPYGESKTYNVNAENVADWTISKPDGWRAVYADGKLTITSPVEDNKYAEDTGTVAIVATSSEGTSLIVKVEVIAYELRVLTFEDADAKFSAYKLNYCNKTISKWSDLIDSKQYGGTMLYGEDEYGWGYGMGMNEPYYWYDENNTELKHTMVGVNSIVPYCYWNGGHAISNYASTDLAQGDSMHQLAVYGAGGHAGSTNFAMDYGYRDNAYHSGYDLPAIEFADGKARVIDHMWVMNSVYAMNCYVSGNGLTAKIGPDDWVKLVATGYDTADNKVGETTIYMCNGPDNIVKDWTKWDLSVLGKVVKVKFNVTGSSDNGHGFSQPAYFAYDDVAVRF